MSFYIYSDQLVFIMSLVSMLHIPLEKYYSIEHFQDILKIKYINLYNKNNNNNNIKDNNIILDNNTANNIINYINIIKELDDSLSSYISFYNTIIFFLSVLLVIAAIFSFIFPFFEKFNYSENKKYIIITNIIELLFSFINLVMTLTNIFKINMITKEYDYNHIGLTSELKRRIIIIIIMMSINILIICCKFTYSLYFIKKNKNNSNTINEGDLEKKTKINESKQTLSVKNETSRELRENKEDKEKKNEEDKIGEVDKEIKKTKYSILKNENENFKIRINNLEEDLKIKDEKILKLEEDLKIKDEKILKLDEYLKIKDEKILKLDEDLRKFKSYFSTSEEELISLIFNSCDQTIKNFNLVAKNSDIFTTLEKKIYDKFPIFKENENYFLANGEKLNRNKTLKENKIKNNDVITLYQFDLENNDK